MTGALHVVRSLGVRLACALLAGSAAAQSGVIGVPATPTIQGDTTAPSQRAPNGVPVARSCSESDLRGGIPCPDFNDQAIVRSIAWTTFLNRNYASLEAMFTSYCAGDILPDGLWKLSEFASAFEGIGVVLSWEQGLEQIHAWQSANQRSDAARYVEANYWERYAWFARGHGYAGTVSKEGWELFGERLRKSRTILEQMIGEKVKCPIVYSTLISILSVSGADEERLRVVYDEGVQRFPQYQRIYFAMAQHYEPRWGGSRERFEAFAEEAARTSEKIEGRGMYARLYWTVDDQFGTPFVDRKSAYPAWPKLKAGFDDLLKRYPSSMHNIAQYASVACRAEDAVLYRSLRAKFVGHEGGRSFDGCDRKLGFQAGATKSTASALAPAWPPSTVAAKPPPDRLPGNCTREDVDSKRLCADFSEGDEATYYLQVAFMQQQFAGVDELFDRWCSGGARQPSGQYRIVDYANALHAIFTAYGHWDEDLATIKRWRAARPGSIAAPYAEAIYWYAYGWKARGPEWSTAASKDDLAIFAERLAHAREALSDLHQRRRACGAPDALYIRVLADLRAPEAQVRSVYESAIKSYPEYHGLYYAMAHYYEPRFGGNAEVFERFARGAARQSSRFEGAGLYARIYEQVDYRGGGLPFNPDAGVPPDWEMLKSGYESLMRRYPSSMVIVSGYASVACRSHDSRLYRNLRSRIVGHEKDAYRSTAGNFQVDICDKRHDWHPGGGA